MFVIPWDFGIAQLGQYIKQNIHEVKLYRYRLHCILHVPLPISIHTHIHIVVLSLQQATTTCCIDYSLTYHHDRSSLRQELQGLEEKQRDLVKMLKLNTVKI